MESRPFSTEDIGPVVFTTRIIVASLAAGVLLFGLFVLASQGINLEAPLGLLTTIATVFGFSTVPLWFVVPSMLVANQMRQIDWIEQRLRQIDELRSLSHGTE